MIMAFIKSRKRPKVTMVTGKVSITRIGLTITLRIPSTTATIIADTYPSTATPGNILDNITTAIAVNNNLRIQFIMFRFRDKDKKTL